MGGWRPHDVAAWSTWAGESCPPACLNSYSSLLHFSLNTNVKLFWSWVAPKESSAGWFSDNYLPHNCNNGLIEFLSFDCDWNETQSRYLCWEQKVWQSEPFSLLYLFIAVCNETIIALLYWIERKELIVEDLHNDWLGGLTWLDFDFFPVQSI